MKTNWFIVSVLASLVVGGISYIYTDSWKISLIVAVIVCVIVMLFNPARRYMKAFYAVLFPLLSNIYLVADVEFDGFELKAGIQELGITGTIVLGVIAITCLILDWFERGGKLKGAIFSSSKNKVGDINGDNNQVIQVNNARKESE